MSEKLEFLISGISALPNVKQIGLKQFAEGEEELQESGIIVPRSAEASRVPGG